MRIRSHQSGRPRSESLLRARQNSSGRSGIVILEFILMLPLLIILLLAVIEFSMIYQVNQQVAYASKFGAKLAAEVTRAYAQNPNLGNFNTGSAPSGQSLKNRIDRYLATHLPAPPPAGSACSVILKHNACSVPNTDQENPGTITTSCNCGTPPTPPGIPASASSPPPDIAYVQVTVALKLQGNVPDLLSSFGFPLGSRTVVQTTTMRVETNNTPPSPVVSGTLQGGGLPGNYSISGGGFPLNCGENMTIHNNSGTPRSLNEIQINFNGGGSSDLEQASGLHYQWNITSSGTGASATPGNGSAATFSPQLQFPPDPDTGMGNQGVNTASYNITLIVTDSCGHTGSCTTHVQLQTYDTNP